MDKLCPCCKGLGEVFGYFTADRCGFCGGKGKAPAEVVDHYAERERAALKGAQP